MKYASLILSSSLTLSLFAACGGGDDGDAGQRTQGGGSGGSSAGSGGSNAGNAGNGDAGSDGTAGDGGSGGSAGGDAGSGGSAGSDAAGGSGGNAGSSAAGGSGAPSPGTCSATQLNCDGDESNGCESNTLTDPQNCGSCGVVCEGGPDHVVGACNGGKCAIACEIGYAACDGFLADGCEVSTASDPNNCGFCGLACPKVPGIPIGCIAGSCGVECQGTNYDCNGEMLDGCEVDVSNDPNNCGSCGKTCGGAGKCVNGACECAGTTAAAVPVQLAMFVMLDKSGSMNDQISGGATRWQTVTSALGQFFASPEAVGIEAALNYFPLETPSGTACTNSYYYNPAVPMGMLPGAGNAHLNALTFSMSKAIPSGGTPTQVALSAALGYAADWKKVFPNDKTIVVLATDGQPADACGANLTNSAAAAAAGIMQDPSVPTYVIGVGPLVSNLDSIAQSGGTNSAFLVNDGNTAAFIAALKQIKLQAIACEYAIPTPASGSTDFSKINVQYSQNGSPSKTLSNTTDESLCDESIGGWFYDDPFMPTKIRVCPSTCAELQADTSAKVEIVLGCDTVKDLSSGALHTPKQWAM